MTFRQEKDNGAPVSNACREAIEGGVKSSHACARQSHSTDLDKALLYWSRDSQAWITTLQHSVQQRQNTQQTGHRLPRLRQKKKLKYV